MAADAQVVAGPETTTTSDSLIAGRPVVLVPNVARPRFLLQAEDDPVDNVTNSLVYYIALKTPGRRWRCICMRQGAMRGLRRTKFPTTGWPQLVETWLGNRDGFEVVRRSQTATKGNM